MASLASAEKKQCPGSMETSKAESRYSLFQPGLIFTSEEGATQINHMSSQLCDKLTTTIRHNLALLMWMIHSNNI